MTRDPASTARGSFWAGGNPWPCLWTGLGLAGLAWLLSGVSTDGLIAVRIILLLAGLVTAGLAVAIRFRNSDWDWDSRLYTAGVTALAALTAIISNFALDAAWDSATLLLRVLTAVGLAGAGLLLMPQGLRRLVISLLVVFHFGGIVCAVTAVPPPNGTTPWVTMMLWMYVYRPYVDFMYLNNAYHFYSPEPGPPSLLWFYVEYEDGTIRELKIPNREDFPTRLAYMRRLALTDSCAGTQPPHPARLEELAHRRHAAGAVHNPPIPMHPDYPLNLQYGEPNDVAQEMLSAYARHVAHNYAHPSDPAVPVKQVKVYRLIHRIITAHEYSIGIEPLDPAMYLPYYEGTYDPDGHLINPDKDPFLYWIIPILKVEKAADVEQIQGPFRSPVGGKRKYNPADYETKNYLEIHAGVK